MMTIVKTFRSSSYRTIFAFTLTLCLILSSGTFKTVLAEVVEPEEKNFVQKSFDDLLRFLHSEPSKAAAVVTSTDPPSDQTSVDEINSANSSPNQPSFVQKSYLDVSEFLRSEANAVAALIGLKEKTEEFSQIPFHPPPAPSIPTAQSKSSVSLSGVHVAELIPFMDTASYSSKSVKLQDSDTPGSGKADIPPESAFPGFHMCVDAGEAYGAAWIATKEHILKGPVDQYNLTWVNCEMASFTILGAYRRVPKPQAVGIIVQTRDVFDLSVLHLSTFERSHKRYMVRMWSDRRERAKAWHNIDPVIDVSRQVEITVKNNLQAREAISKAGGESVYTDFAKRTLVMMPFLGGAMGAGHSVLSNRYHYLRACFWSIFEYFPNIAMGVTQKSDVDWGLKQSNMPWFDVVLFNNLPKSAGLPVGTVQYTKKMLKSGKWDFDYVLYTESDQIFFMKKLLDFQKYLDAFPRRVLVPHRLMVYSDRVMSSIHNRLIPSKDGTNQKLDVISRKARGSLEDWKSLSCCIPNQNCLERSAWVHASNPALPLLNYSGVIIPLGNSNFLLETYRGCIMQRKGSDVCPP